MVVVSGHRNKTQPRRDLVKDRGCLGSVEETRLLCCVHLRLSTQSTARVRRSLYAHWYAPRGGDHRHLRYGRYCLCQAHGRICQVPDYAMLVEKVLATGSSLVGKSKRLGRRGSVSVDYLATSPHFRSRKMSADVLSRERQRFASVSRNATPAWGCIHRHDQACW